MESSAHSAHRFRSIEDADEPTDPKSLQKMDHEDNSKTSVRALADRIDGLALQNTHERVADALSSSHSLPKPSRAVPPCLPEWEDDLRDLELLFPGLIEVSRRGDLVAHQPLVTALIGNEYAGSQRSSIMTWQQLEEQLAQVKLHEYLKLSLQTPLVIVILDTGFPYKGLVKSRYSTIERYIDKVGTRPGLVSVHPSRAEAEADGEKLPDIRALDEVARVHGDWRPITCFGSRKKCALTGKRDFKKRSWSGCSSHTGETGSDETKSATLNCLTNDHIATLKLTRQPWFHQEYVPFLNRNEFRVFIVTKLDPEGLRGLKGTVLRVCFTRDEVEDGLLSRESRTSDYEAAGLTQSQVHAFSLRVFESLRRLHSPRFKSLEVGCRLDISAREPGGPLFVNEVTRWYGAYYFSAYCTPLPHTMICDAYASAFVNVHRPQLKENKASV
ncbi:hypothetical protein CkaCkLH20_11406 [Colletotrichum karsti]|uniref:Uncharacterized protein n=1 Tax=Colletotrichum karsti TaxID=1095194 RepID=A0A9P6LD71_9PEZI|nr:uncharacterized protein CkaCkLH20_11406 [Colletotrichum karsti]KAF9870989.1 hypothetical protein CkaCkLH20_11406 [Colletotrichum karsti]